MKAKFCFVCVFYSNIVEGMMIVKYWSASKYCPKLTSAIRERQRKNTASSFIFRTWHKSLLLKEYTGFNTEKKSRHRCWERYPNYCAQNRYTDVENTLYQPLVHVQIFFFILFYLWQFLVANVNSIVGIANLLFLHSDYQLSLELLTGDVSFCSDLCIICQESVTNTVTLSEKGRRHINIANTNFIPSD